jgi:predicted kinase
MYVADHPLALCLEGDQLISMIGEWPKYETRARKLVYAYMKPIIAIHLKAGYDVVLPYVLTNAMHVTELEKLAESCEAAWAEVYLRAPRDEAVARLMKRGRWGEVNAPPLTSADLPIVEALFDKMAAELQKRPNTLVVESVEGQIAETYKQLLAVLATV